MAIKTAYVSKLGKDHLISPHFKLKEFQSKDGADKVLYSEELLAKLEELRAYGGYTIVVNSGYRSAAHNKKVGGATNSNHTKGLAADIVVKKDGKTVNAELICCLCQTLGFKGVAYISSSAVHVDVRTSGSYRGDERKGYSNNVGNDFYSYFGRTRAEVEAMKVKESEEVSMTQEQFDNMIDVWLEKRKTKLPASWSEKERSWAEWENIILGDTLGNMAYQSFCTREEMVVFLYRLAKLLEKEGQ